MSFRANDLRSRPRFGRAILLALLSTPLAAGFSEDRGAAPLWSWRFASEHADGQTFAPVGGALPAKSTTAPRFGEVSPGALLLAGDAGLDAFSGSLAELTLPLEALTVESWVLIEKRQEWGGIVSLVRDNGDDEKGWILGFDTQRFYFGIASEGRRRLTYLRGVTPYAPGYWYHVVGTYDGREQRLYVDGRLESSSGEQNGKIIYPTNGFLSVGAYRDEDETHPLRGAMATASVWSNTLPPEEIRTRFDDSKRAFPGSVPLFPGDEDWPTHLHDNQRTGVSPSRLDLPLALLWTHAARHPPAPAWPPPARQDFWHEKQRLAARVTYDRALPLVAAGERVWYASSADDQVRCLDARSGDVLWSFFAEGPVRLAPTLAGESLVFGSDDGLIRAVEAATGELLWRSGPFGSPGVAPRRIAGNGRVISPLPVRSGVLVEDGHAFACAGLFPSEGVVHVALDLETGEEIARTPLESSVQGYLARRGGRLYAATGRNRRGAFIGSLQRRGKDVPAALRAIPPVEDDAFVGTEDLRLAGGNGRVAAYDAETGELLWQAAVDGRAHVLAIARERLFVSTDRGTIHAFGRHRAAGERKSASRARPAPGAARAELGRAVLEGASSIITSSAHHRGHALVLFSRRAELAAALAAASEWTVVAATSEANAVSAARASLSSYGLYGRVAVHRIDTDELPYSSSLFNLVVDAREKSPEDRLLPAEMRRVLAPSGLLLAADGTLLWQRPAIERAGRWTHLYADPGNTACSEEERIDGPLRLQWFGRPGPERLVDRHHRSVPPLVDAGRLFVPGDERVFAVDVYNGTVLWERELPGTRRVGVLRDTGSMAVDGDRLYVAGASGCRLIDAASGRVVATWEVPSPPASSRPTKRQASGSKAEPPEWGYVAVGDDLLIGSAVAPGATRRGHSREAINDTYYDARPLVGSFAIFARERADGELRWDYRPRGRLALNPTLAVSADSVQWVETKALDEATLKAGRVALEDALGKGAEIVALGRENGVERWRVPSEIVAEHNLYLVATDGKVLLVGSRNSGADKKNDRVLFEIRVLDARSGNELWRSTQTQPSTIGGSHGEQDYHPTVIGGTLFCEPHAYDIETGARLADFGWRERKRHGCGTVSASASALFFRDSTASRFDLGSKKYGRVTAATRPGCWINMIPAGGMLLVPEASSGCTCDYAVQASLGFAPAD